MEGENIIHQKVMDTFSKFKIALSNWYVCFDDFFYHAFNFFTFTLIQSQLLHVRIKSYARCTIKSIFVKLLIFIWSESTDTDNVKLHAFVLLLDTHQFNEEILLYTYTVQPKIPLWKNAPKKINVWPITFQKVAWQTMAFFRERGRTYIFRSINLEMLPLSELNSILNYILLDECWGQQFLLQNKVHPTPLITWWL